MADAFIRAQNASPKLFAQSVPSVAPSSQRGTINEAGFLLFKQTINSGAPNPESINDEVVVNSMRAAFSRNEELPKSLESTLDLTLLFGRYEALAIAKNLISFFAEEEADVTVNPRFPGCGWVNASEADILCGTTLYEVKAGERHFRVADLRQLLTYCALNFASKQTNINSISLINPRSGAIVREPLDTLCRRISGTSSVRVLSEIVSFISDHPSGAYLRR